MRSGFSLIELLVVVAIIGILAAVGVVGYQGYIDATKDEAAKANMNMIARAVKQDTLSISENLGGATDLNQGLNADSLCSEQLDAIIAQVNDVDEGRNTHKEKCFRVFNGNRLLNDYTSTVSSNMKKWGLTDVDQTSISDCGFEAPVTASPKSVKVPRGAIMLACTNMSAKIGASDYKLYTCACTGEASCTTADIDHYSESDTPPGCSGAADVTACKRDYLINNPTQCPTPGN